MDLISTIGESAALGSAGVIFWGDSEDASSMVRETHLACQSRQGVYALASALTWVYRQCSFPPKQRGFVPGPKREGGHPHPVPRKRKCCLQ